MTSFFEKCILSTKTKENNWLDNVESAHNLWCSCTNWLIHLLDIAIPHDSPNRDYTIEQLIQQQHAIIRALPSLPAVTWPGPTGDAGGHSAGDAGGNGGGPEDAGIAEPIPEDDLIKLLEETEQKEKDEG